MEYLQTIFENTSFPLFSAFLLGLMTAISPCPMATNITAIGFISKDLEKSRKVIINGLIYTLGRALGYFGLAAVFYLAADQFQIAGFFQVHGEKIIGPFLIVIGLLMLDFIPIKFPGLNAISEKFEKRNKQTFLSILILGVVFALAFCPYSGVLFFGMLIPLTISSSGGLALPIVFAIGTSIPVIIFAWIIANAVSGIGKVYNKIKGFELWFRRIIALVFIGVGTYYIILLFF